MNKSLDPAGNLPGLQGLPSPPPQAPAARPPAPPRFKPVDRSQLVWRSVDVEHLIAEDHPARAIWELTGQLDLSAFYAPIQAVEGRAGRTPWNPRLLISLWIYAYSRGISSAREVSRRCASDPAFEWLCGLEGINHHTLSDFRVVHGPALQHFFVQLLGVLSAQGLVSLERVMHDGTKIKAWASGKSFRREPALQAHLEAARQQVQALSQQAEEDPSRQKAAQERAARERLQRVEQALEQLQAIRQSKATEEEKAAARASESDPTARVMKQADGGFAPAYNVQLSTEASHKIIVGQGVSQNASDGGQLMDGVERIQAHCQAPPQQMVTDGGFTTRAAIMEMAARGIDLIGPMPDHRANESASLKRRGIDAAFSGKAFAYDAVLDTYRCPASQTLHPATPQEHRPGGVTYQYRARPGTCARCEFKARCCPQAGSQGRSVNRWVENPVVREFRQKMQTPQAQAIYKQRAPVAEFPHAWIKDKLGLRQFRLRGLAKVSWEVLWACLTYNIQQWIRLCWRPSLAGAQN